VKINISRLIILLVFLTAISSMICNTKGVTTFAQSEQKNANNSVDYAKFHTHVQELIGPIEKAIYDKNTGDNLLAFAHTRLSMDEPWPLITIPLNNVDTKLNSTFGNALNNLSNAVLPGHNKITKAEFIKSAQDIINLSQKVTGTVIPAAVLGNTSHNVAVINDLLAQAVGEYGEGVQNSKVIAPLEIQEAQAFVHRAYDMFNNTKPISNSTEVSKMFNNITNSVLQHVPQSKIDSMTVEIKDKLSDLLSTSTHTSTSNQNNSSEGSSNITSLGYISKIRLLLDQTLTSYQSGNYAKAKELATTAYIDNFEFIEKPIGPTLQHQGEDLLREKLRSQIDSKVPLEEIKSNIAQIDKLLDKSALSLTY
jgi:hypothetical protein